MKYTLRDCGGFLRADLLERETAEETEAFLLAVRGPALAHPSERLLISVHCPRAIFRVERYHASRFIGELAGRPRGRVALVARHFEVRLVHQYIEALARLRHAGLRSFADESAAIAWLAVDEKNMHPRRTSQGAV